MSLELLPVCLCFASTFARGVDFGRGWIELHYRFGGLAHFFRRCFARGFDSPLRSLLYRFVLQICVVVCVVLTSLAQSWHRWLGL